MVPLWFPSGKTREAQWEQYEASFFSLASRCMCLPFDEILGIKWAPDQLFAVSRSYLRRIIDSNGPIARQRRFARQGDP